MKPERAALPTTLQISQTKIAITSYQNSLQSIATRLSSTQAHLDRVTRENKHILETLQNEKHDLELKIAQARSYLAPIRRLPTELLGVVFTRTAHADPIAPWTISAVCRLWREQILSMSNLWSTIRLKTSIAMAPDTIRLWLERSGTISPLDIEIRLRVSVNTIETVPSRGSASIHVQHLNPPNIGDGLWQNVQPIQSIFGLPTTLGGPPPLVGVASSFPTVQQGAEDGNGSGMSASQQLAAQNQRAAASWGHVAMYYLVASMPRWKRFVFKFDRPFSSMRAFDSIIGPAPLLEEFSVSCAELVSSDRASQLDNNLGPWSWLPSSSSRTHSAPKLCSLELGNMPFRWDAPILKQGRLRKLVIRASTSSHTQQPLALNRLLSLLASNPELRSVTMSLPCSPPVLPLNPLRLEHLRAFKLGGGHEVAILDQLILPSLRSLSIESEGRLTHGAGGSGLEDSLTNLILRSGNPSIKHFSYSASSSSAFYPYGTVGSSALTPTFLGKLSQLRSLSLTATPVEAILSALCTSTPGDDDEEDDGGVPQFGLFPPGGGTLGGFGAFGGLNTPVGGPMNPATNPNTPANPPAAPVDGICPLLNRLSIRATAIQQDTIPKLIKVVAARGRKLEDGGVAPDDEPTEDEETRITSDDHEESDGEPELFRLRRLELKMCGYIGADVIDWLRERLDKVDYKEGNAPGSRRGRGSLFHAF